MENVFLCLECSAIRLEMRHLISVMLTDKEDNGNLHGPGGADKFLDFTHFLNDQ